MSKGGCHEGAAKLGERGAKNDYGDGFNTSSKTNKGHFNDGTIDSYKGTEIKGHDYTTLKERK